jgi:hypothetical protein
VNVADEYSFRQIEPVLKYYVKSTDENALRCFLGYFTDFPEMSPLQVDLSFSFVVTSHTFALEARWLSQITVPDRQSLDTAFHVCAEESPYLDCLLR